MSRLDKLDFRTGMGVKWISKEYTYHRRLVTDWNKARSGDIIDYPDHVEMVVENLHNGTLLVTNGTIYGGADFMFFALLVLVRLNLS